MYIRQDKISGGGAYRSGLAGIRWKFRHIFAEIRASERRWRRQNLPEIATRKGGFSLEAGVGRERRVDGFCAIRCSV